MRTIVAHDPPSVVGPNPNRQPLPDGAGIAQGSRGGEEGTMAGDFAVSRKGRAPRRTGDPARAVRRLEIGMAGDSLPDTDAKEKNSAPAGADLLRTIDDLAAQQRANRAAEKERALAEYARIITRAHRGQPHDGDGAVLTDILLALGWSRDSVTRDLGVLARIAQMEQELTQIPTPDEIEQLRLAAEAAERAHDCAASAYRRAFGAATARSLHEMELRHTRAQHEYLFLPPAAGGTAGPG